MTQTTGSGNVKNIHDAKAQDEWNQKVYNTEQNFDEEMKQGSDHSMSSKDDDAKKYRTG